MTVGIRSAVAVFPRARDSGLPIAGDDEDAFTLAVEAVEALRGPEAERPLASVHFVGPEIPDLEDGLAQAVGRPGLSVVSHAQRRMEWFEAVSAASRSPEPTHDVVVVAVDLSEPRNGTVPRRGGTSASAIRLGPDGAIRLVGSSEATEGRGGADADRSALTRLFGAFSPSDPPGLESLVDPPSGAGSTEPSERIAPILEALRAVSLAPRASPARWALTGRSGAGSFVAGFELLGPISWPQKGFDSGGAPPPSARGGGAPAGRPPYTVSEGAYVPRATYRATRPTRWRLAAAHCGHCDGWSFPAAPSCRHCGKGDRLEGRELARAGLRVEAATTVVPGAQPTEFDAQVARTGAIEVVLARTLQGPLVTLQLTDAPAGSVRVGDRVDACLRRLYPMEGEWRYGLKAVPAAAPPPLPDPPMG